MTQTTPRTARGRNKSTAGPQPDSPMTSSQSSEKSSKLVVTAEQRSQMIRELAYLKAELRGFSDGSPEQDWLAAELEIDNRLAQSV